MAKSACLLTELKNWWCINQFWKPRNVEIIIPMDIADSENAAIFDIKKMRNPERKKTYTNFIEYWILILTLFLDQWLAKSPSALPLSITFSHHTIESLIISVYSSYLQIYFIFLYHEILNIELTLNEEDYFHLIVINIFFLIFSSMLIERSNFYNIALLLLILTTLFPMKIKINSLIDYDCFWC